MALEILANNNLELDTSNSIEGASEMKRLVISVISAWTFGIVGTSVQAHHSFAVHFDPTSLASVQGTVQRWEVETHSIPLLRRVNIDQDTFEIGQTLMVEYNIVDPVFLTESYTGSTQWRRLAEGTPIEPFGCDAATAAQSTSQGA